MHTLRQYLLTLSDPEGLLRTLAGAEVCRDARGALLYAAGNSAAVFRIRHRGQIRALRCYLRPMRHLREIYGERFLERELYLYDTAGAGTWVDVVVGEWIEGETLSEAAERAAAERDTQRLQALAAAFDALAARLVSDDRAHGDLKPENIIVDAQGILRLIDFDAAYLPEFAGEQSPELGTAAYQHPARTAADFNAQLDDFPAALISTALHALALDPSLRARHAESDGMLFTPREILRGRDAAYREVMELFERRGMALQYRIARLLASPTPQLFGLAEFLAASVREAGTALAGTPPERLELYVEHGLWGYRTPERVVIPPRYDNGFDFSEGWGAVQLGRTWHFIDGSGRVCLSCPGCDSVKPFRNGCAQVVRNGRRMQIDRAGNETPARERQSAREPGPHAETGATHAEAGATHAETGAAHPLG